MSKPPSLVETDRTAVLDSAHVGDITGAFGTIAFDDLRPRRSFWHRLRTLAAILGPGLIVMVADNDAGGVSTYAQAGQNYGNTLLWTLLILVPVLIVNQEMAARLGAVTGVGHARLIKERFGRFWGWFSVGDLFALNFLTIVTEFIGVSLALAYFGIPPTVSVPIAAAGLILIAVTGSFRRWERFMFVFLFTSLLFIPLALMVHPTAAPIMRGTFLLGALGGFNGKVVLLIVAIVGTTVAPWQLFFQQSSVVDKRISTRWIRYERADTIMGAFVTNIAAAGFMVACAYGLLHTRAFGNFVDAGQTAVQLRHAVGYAAGAMFALILLNASCIGAGAVTLSSSYAFGDMFTIKHSLHRRATDAKGFYAMYSVQVVIAAGIVLIPHAPLGFMTTMVQVLAGVLLPSATVFLLLLCNDREILGPWVNANWLNMVTSAIIGVLVMLSLILVTNTLFPQLDVVSVTAALGAILAAILLVGGAVNIRARHRREVPEVADRNHWRMPPLEELLPPVRSRARMAGLVVLRGYLILSVLLIAVKAVQVVFR